MYKRCVVVDCPNDNINSPEKLFIYIPKKAELRKKWLILAGRKPGSYIENISNACFCEDHFNLEKDLRNYHMYRMGFCRKILMVKGAMPSKFDCQKVRSETPISETAVKVEAADEEEISDISEVPAYVISKSGEISRVTALEPEFEFVTTSLEPPCETVTETGCERSVGISDAIAAFNTAVKWAEENSVCSADLTVLRNLRELVINTSIKSENQT